MLADTIKRIERQYEIKRNKADALFIADKKAVYDKAPKLSEIDKEITKWGIQTARLSINEKSAENAKAVEELQKRILDLKNEKEKILKEMHIVLAPKYDCLKCNDTGYILKDGHSEMCSCMKQELLNDAYNKSNMHNLQNENFDNLDLTLFSNIKEESKYKSELSPRENIEKIIKVSKQFINNFDDPKEKNLLFTGTTGIGKTYISSCIANDVLKKGCTVLYQTAPVLLDSIFSYKYNSNNSKELYDNLFSVNLLIIDDLGTENLTAAKFTEIFTILNSRLLTPNTKTIISTNFSLEELSKMYDSRILSRIIGNYVICRFFGEDIRLKH